jgi:type I restriction enzyme S subunit
MATGDLGDEADVRVTSVTYEGRPSRADLTGQPGDVCFARMAATRKVLEFTQDHRELILSTGFAILRPIKAEVHPAYLRHWLSSGTFQAAKDRLCTGATQKAITNEKMSLLTIPLPGRFNDQIRIAEILDQAYSLTAKRRASLVRVDTLTQSIFLDMFGDPKLNSRHWPWQKLADLGSLDRGVSKHRPRNAPELLGGPYPFVQTGDVANCDGYIRTHSATYSEEGLRQSRIWPAGTLCITIAANIAKTGILTFEACFPDSVVGFRAEDRATVEYVRVWLSFLQASLERSAPESAQKNINLEILRALDVPAPDVELRRKFAGKLDAIERCKGSFRQAIDRLDALFVGVQHRAFRGEL